MTTAGATTAPAVSGAGRRETAVAALLFLAVALALFHDVVFGGRQLFYRDLAMQWHPQVEAFVRSIGAGSWPLWNPYISFGQPLLANPNAQLIYPITWLQLLMPVWTFYAWYVTVHTVLAGCGMFALGRNFRLSRGAALAAGLVWVLSGPFLSLVNLWHHLAGAAWLPWATLAADRALRAFSIPRALAWGACMALLVVSGSPESVLMGVVMAAGLCVVHAPSWWREPSRLRPAIAAAALAAVMALGLSAGQWLPTLDVARSSRRSDLPVAAREYWSVHPWSLAQVALPVFPDRLPLQSTWRALLYDSREPFLLSLYVGLPVLAFACLGVGGPGGRGRVWWTLAALAGLSIVFALGRHTPVYQALASLIPPLRTLRYPSKAIVPASFCIALVAGRGFDAWSDGERSDRRRMALGVALVAAGLAAIGAGWWVGTGAQRWGQALLLPDERSPLEMLAPSIRSLFVCGALTAAMGVSLLLAGRSARARTTAGAALVLAVVDLAAAQRGLNPTAPTGALAGRPPVLSVAAPAAYQRMYVFDYARTPAARRLLGHNGFVLTTPRGTRNAWDSERALVHYAHPALLGLWGLEGSYGVDALKLLSQDVNTVNALVETSESSPGPTHRLLRLGAVDTVIAMHSRGFEELRPLASLPSSFPGPMLVFRVDDALPRAYVAGRARIAPPGQGWRALLAPDLEPEREVVLPDGPARDTGARGVARIVEFRPDSVTLEADLDAPGYVVLVDAYDKGWQATVDGQPAGLLRANVAFRAVEAPAGHHVIRFLYRPASVKAGLAISALAVLCAAVLGTAHARWGARPATAPA
ncbi:MAG TPA: YfhO family protein [Vicinamibacteria bacterium]|nr:YfhO family protein [Vicinamibacteria bacterium]